MKVTKIANLKEFTEISEQSDVTIGFFDGVHRGHQKLISELERSKEKRIIITFDSHPNKAEIMGINHKISLLQQFQVEEIIVITMNDVNKRATAQEFITFLKKLNINKIIVGADFHFGTKASGNVLMLKDNFEVEVVDFIEEDNQKISSTNLREALKQRDLKYYYRLTGRNYSVIGRVEYGNQIGRTINFPTANIETEDQIIGNGVYLTKVKFNNKSYNSITNVGTRPTVNGKKIKIESHIIDFNDIIYNINIEVEFIKLIRDEMKFSSLEDLKMQIYQDKKVAKEYYGNKTIN